MKNQLTLLVLLGLLLCTIACNKASLIGSDILPSEDDVNVIFTDSFDISAKTIRSDSAKVFDLNPSLQPVNYLLGKLNDPVFGVSSSDIYTQFGLLVTSPDFSNAELDSIVLSLEYNGANVYGDMDAPFSFEVYELAEDLPDTASIYSDATFALGDKIGELLNFVPKPQDSVLVDTVLTIPHITVRLDDAFGERLLDTMNSSFYSDDNSFEDFLKGIALVGDANNQGMLSFNLLGALSKMTLYYTKDDTLSTSYNYVIKSQSVKSMNFEHDYSMADVNDFFGSETLGDSLVLIQSMDGTEVEVKINNIADLGNIIVNKAELVLTVAADGESDLFPPANQLIVTEENEDGNKVLIEDVIISLNQASDLAAIFGGELEDIGTRKVYKINLSGHFQNVVDGILPNNAIFISTFPKSSQANRIILGGAKHSQYPLQFRLTYTKID